MVTSCIRVIDPWLGQDPLNIKGQNASLVQCINRSPGKDSEMADLGQEKGKADS